MKQVIVTHIPVESFKEMLQSKKIRIACLYEIEKAKMLFKHPNTGALYVPVK